MRPLEITLEGFKSYRKPQTFSFESRSLFGIVGPTGSGKSTILEALIFALYGKTPRVERETKKLINTEEEQARVQLTFEVDESVWEIVRIIRRKGTSQTLLRKLTDSSVEPVSGERAATERITEIIGLDFAAFCSSVSLPQGEFDRFLNAAPAERSRILKGIFRLERVDLLRERARAAFASVDGQIVVLKAVLDALPPDPELLLAALNDDLAAAADRYDQIGQALPEVVRAEQDLRSGADQIARLEESARQTSGALSRLPAEETLRDLSDRQETGQRRLREAVAALTRAVAELAQAHSTHETVLSETGGDEWFTAVGTLLAESARLHETITAAEGEAEKLRADVGTLSAAREKAFGLLTEAQQVHSSAQSALNELQQLHAAHLLRHDLHPGDHCPVCEQKVAVVPASAELPGLMQARERLQAADETLAQAREGLEKAKRDRAIAGERLSLVLDALDARRGERDTCAERLTGLAGQDPATELHRRQLALAEARAGAQKAAEARDAADRTERRAREELERMAESIRSALNLLTHTSGLLGLATVSPDQERLWDAAKRVIEAGSERLASLAAGIGDLRSRAETDKALLEQFRTRFGAAAGENAADLLAGSKAEVLRLRMRIEEVEAGITRRRESEARIAELSIRRGRFERLVADFSDSKFTAFLLDEQRRLLSRIGSEKFLELTGHYVFDDEGQFQIVDQRTGATRSPDTLSGGETFLASLSLALALAEAVALEGGRLGCFFLDEGFGSLDQESLDLALEGIEALAVPGRLIGLISHVGGIQARLDDLIVLERLNDGSTEVAQYEGPIGYAPGLI